MKLKKPINSFILTMREQKVILASDLAELYGVPTKRLNEQVKRNANRFPEDFMFQVTAREWTNLKSQIATSSWGGARRALPYAFTEHGAIMAATVLNSNEAVAMSLYVVRAFIQMREQLAANHAILKRLAEIDKTLLQHDAGLRDVYRKLQPLLQPPPDPPRRRIGFHPGDKA